MKNSILKKAVLAVVSAAAMVASSSATGQIQFFNLPDSAIVVDGNPATKMFGSAGTYDFGLYMGSAGTLSISDMQLVALATSPNAPAATSFNAGIFAYLPNRIVTSPGNVANTLNFQAGTQYAFYVAGWQASGGSDFFTADASGVETGLSSLGFITPATGTTPIPNVFGTSPGQVLGFLIGTPEPSTLALGGLGAAALLLLRRSK